ncbi:hypothetical protein B4U79_18690 [Dinothrombium tinctorium]|uniref:FCP1 homology domain-containing protein n=1 Tax=Dinothrombium tinctorium TaxID=1965070 RepID=A0A3S3NIX0_9ACAR|nr:hypothetical protein B4U79_18690 [Dinothrombium tinctorium]
MSTSMLQFNDLTKVTTDLKRVVMIDERFAALREHLSNVIFIEHFQGNEEDDWLFPKKFIWEFLNIHSKTENIRLEIVNCNTAAKLRNKAEEKFRQMRNEGKEVIIARRPATASSQIDSFYSGGKQSVQTDNLARLG